MNVGDRFRTVVAALLSVIAAAAALVTLLLEESASPFPGFLQDGAHATGSVNIPTAILMDYRAFDTLGEASVIFGSAVVIAAILGTPRFAREDQPLGLLSRRALVYLLPLFLIFPSYVITNGHRSPGGGFQGGVSIAVLVILLHVAFGNRFALQRVSLRFLGFVEYLGALAFLATGILGILLGSSFLANVVAGVPRGTPGALLSGGIIPVLNIIVGCKVAAGLSSIYCHLAGGGD
ncbi:multicomponent Na+:H+ antiporter subunit B [Alkalispirochaeta americana]|uniref:Multicomponent Na+:H+ antiporter subunit B n=1 Tax=Alkalispirochaeta americana TaxID=159291 RepID=A0A1N6TG98_9SPIO|nr:hydrogen gas-evolving membrane-bound hydrogenase subunit E [Alkalispirochaeta americana]SIQ52146.1 multicomponent Na+:H+ antiporter subunit B [Alkalispirochaeta americana]